MGGHAFIFFEWGAAAHPHSISTAAAEADVWATGALNDNSALMLTNAGLKAFGFEPFAEGESFSATFYALRIFEARGITAKSCEALHHQVFIQDGVRYAFGSSLNDLTRSLISEEFGDEHKWRQEKKAAPPYLMVLVGPTTSFDASSGFLRREDGLVVTHDAFPSAKQELASLEATRLEPLITALSVAFLGRSSPVEWIPRDRHTFGRTREGGVLRDVRIEFSATAHTAAPLSNDELASRVLNAQLIEKGLEARIGKFYHMGLFETDPLKSFLFHFLFLERFTHATFQRLTQRDDIAAVLRIPDELRDSGGAFARAAVSETRSLSPRFMWCALLAWSGVTDEDVARFKELKRERDRLSHGERTSVSTTLARQARELGGKLLRAAYTAPASAP